jgi:hypothetical protein
MEKLIIMKPFSILFPALLITAISCKESKLVVIPNNVCFEVSYVTGICGQAVLKIENPAFFKFGETWNGNTNVFYTVFDCSVDEMKLKQTRFFVTISQNNPNPNINCFMCLAALDYQGSKKHFVTIVAECNVTSGD